MGAVITIGQSKGGVGKTTLATNLAARLHDLGCPALLIDLDSQANASVCVLPDMGKDAYTLADVFTGKLTPRAAIRNTARYGDILPGGAGLSLLNQRPVKDIAPTFKQLIKAFSSVYDYVIIDTARTLDALSSLTYTVTDRLIIPAEPDLYNMVALRDLSQIVTAARAVNPGLTVAGIALLKYTPQVKAVAEIAETFAKTARDLFHTELYKTRLRFYRAAYTQAGLNRIPVFDIPGKAADDMKSLLDEIITSINR